MGIGNDSSSSEVTPAYRHVCLKQCDVGLEKKNVFHRGQEWKEVTEQSVRP